MTIRITRSMPYLISALFIAPLIIRGGYIFPFIVPKILFLRTLIVFMLALYTVLLVSDFNRFRPRFSFLTISILFFWVSFAISTFAGVDWYRSFWDNHERMLGLFTITHYVLLYLIATATIGTEKQWTVIFRSALLLGSLVMVIGMWQRFVDPQILLNQGGTRVSATLGNAIYYSGYGLFLLFLGCIQFIREQSKTWKWTSAICAILGFIGIFLGGTRGAIIGLVAGGSVVIACYSLFSPGKALITRVARYTAVAGIILLTSLIIFRQTDFVSGLPGVGRLLNTSLAAETEGTRGMAWKIAIEAWKEKPVFGWGPNNYYYAFNEYYNPGFLRYGWGETWFDNAHSVIFNTLTVQGAVGILLYLTIYGVAITWLAIGIRRGKVRLSVGFLSIGFLVAHFIGLATVFENPTSYLYFFVFLGFVAYMIREVHVGKKISTTEVVSRKNSSEKNISPAVAVIIGVVCFVFLFITNINPARANKATTRAMQQVYSGTATAEVYTEPLLYGSPHSDDIRNDISRSVLEVIHTLVQNKKTENLGGLLNKAIEELQKNRLLHPLDIRVNYTLYTLFDYGYQLTGDKALLAQGEKEIRDALLLSPKRQQFEYALAQVLIQQEKYGEAKEVIQTSVNNDERIGEGWFRLAAITLQQDSVEEAQKIINRALEKNVVFSEAHIQTLQSVGLVVKK